MNLGVPALSLTCLLHAHLAGPDGEKPAGEKAEEKTLESEELKEKGVGETLDVKKGGAGSWEWVGQGLWGLGGQGVGEQFPCKPANWAELCHLSHFNG